MSQSTPDTIVIDRLAEDEIPSVKTIEQESDLAPWSLSGYLSEIANPDSCCLVAKSKGLIVGFLIARLIMSEESAELYNIAVKNAFRRKKSWRETTPSPT